MMPTSYQVASFFLSSVPVSCNKTIKKIVNTVQCTAQCTNNI